MSKALPGFSLNSFISPSPSGDWYKNVNYEDAKNMIKEKMMSSAENFVAIGYYLKHIDETGQYKEGGYTSIWDCAMQEFGFSQSKTSRCINICKKYSADGDSPYMNERFKNFDISQLQEMLPIKDEHLIEQITPDMSTREIRNVKNARDTKEETDTKILEGQMQLTTIEGEYRELAPAADMPDKESPVQEQDDPVPEEKTRIISAGSEKAVPDMGEDQSEAAQLLCNDENINFEKCHEWMWKETGEDGSGDPRTDNKEPAEHFCYDLERVKIQLPCAVGETVYFYEGGSMKKGTVDQITLGEQMKPLIRVYDADSGAWFYFEVSDFGVIVFFTKDNRENN